LDGTDWNQLGADIDGESAFDNSGWSTSISADGDTVAIGARYNDGGGANVGHVRVYRLDGTDWNQLGADIDGEAICDRSGFFVSMSANGGTVAVGAPYNGGNGQNAGHVRVYRLDGTNWNQLGADIDGEASDDQSGRSVSMSADGERIAIGAPGNDGNGSKSGHVKIYQLDGTNWNQLGSDIDGGAAGDESGYSVAMSDDGERVAIGAYEANVNGSGSGHVRVFWLDGTNWNQLGADIDGEAANDYSGTFVSISADGGTVAVSASYNDGNGFSSGHVRMYRLDGANWKQLGDDIDGEGANDQSGTSVSISANGDRVAIGAENNGGNGSKSGHVRVYQYASESKLPSALPTNFPTRILMLTVGVDTTFESSEEISLPEDKAECSDFVNVLTDTLKGVMFSKDDSREAQTSVVIPSVNGLPPCSASAGSPDVRRISVTSYGMDISYEINTFINSNGDQGIVAEGEQLAEQIVVALPLDEVQAAFQTPEIEAVIGEVTLGNMSVESLVETAVRLRCFVLLAALS
jgi:hypothetical protein